MFDTTSLSSIKLGMSLDLNFLTTNKRAAWRMLHISTIYCKGMDSMPVKSRRSSGLLGQGL